MAKRKAENRSFLDRWKAEYLFIYVKDRPVCLVCGVNVAVTKEYNIRQHYETKHHDKYKNLNMTQRRQKVEEMKKSLVSQQNVFKKATSLSEAAVKASYIVAGETTKSARPFNEGEFVKTYLCEQLFSSMKMTKTSLRRRLTDEHLCSILRISSAQSLSPDIDQLASKKRCQVSGLGTSE